MLGFLKCIGKEHTPNRKKVRHLEGDVYVSRCDRCRCRILRLRRNNWIRIWPWQWGRYEHLQAFEKPAQPH